MTRPSAARECTTATCLPDSKEAGSAGPAAHRHWRFPARPCSPPCARWRPVLGPLLARARRAVHGRVMPSDGACGGGLVQRRPRRRRRTRVEAAQRSVSSTSSTPGSSTAPCSTTSAHSPPGCGSTRSPGSGPARCRPCSPTSGRCSISPSRPRGPSSRSTTPVICSGSAQARFGTRRPRRRSRAKASRTASGRSARTST